MAPDPNRDSYVQLIEARADVAGRFVGLKYQGDGHFSIVFRATDSTTNREIAVKVFRPDKLDAYRFGCFCREALILEQLVGFPHIVQWISAKNEFVVHLSTTAGIPFTLTFPYFAVELATSDVAALLRAGSLDAEAKLVVFREMCKAVQMLHNEEIAHRDIKPSNFLLTQGGAVALSDFGTARKVDGSEPPILNSYPCAPGDIRYTSPEMNALLHDEEPAVAKKADIFALGATLFELFTGAILCVQLFDARFARDLALTMGAVHKRDRKRIYLSMVQNLDVAHPLPPVSSFAYNTPRCISSLVDRLYKSMAALDYTKRVIDFETIFLRIDQCLLVLRNEEKIKRWQARKEAYRDNRRAKLERREAKRIESLRNG
jgi:serine/threonine protein kinase